MEKQKLPPDEDRPTGHEEALKRLERKEAEIQEFILAMVNPDDPQQLHDSRDDYDPVSEAEEMLDENRKRQADMRCQIRRKQDHKVASGIWERGRSLADQARTSREPRVKALTWTLSAIGAVVITTSYGFLRDGATHDVRFFLLAAMFTAALALAAHLFVQLLHVFVDHVVMARATSLLSVESFDDPLAIYEWLDASAQAMARWHVRLPTIGVFLQGALVIVAFFMMLIAVTSIP